MPVRRKAALTSIEELATKAFLAEYAVAQNNPGTGNSETMVGVSGRETSHPDEDHEYTLSGPSTVVIVLKDTGMVMADKLE